jgi:Asp-tRNA(Asn)/Glu-tRNA(Gln) amidotransferase A subunit family amidase
VNSESDETWLSLSAAGAIAAIREGRFSSCAYTEWVLERARKFSRLNSLIHLNEQGAMDAARRIDRLVGSGSRLPPLAGLPIVVKDNINSADMPTTGGTPGLKGFRPLRNAPALQSLLDAGAILIGKSNLHELSVGTSGVNLSEFAGAVKNPYNMKMIAGGSSGGTAAAIAARIVPAGLGTDCGGSVRIPSALSGVVGFRPSVGNGRAQRRYDSTGVLPLSGTRDTVGVMGRSLRDAVTIDAVLSGVAEAQPADVRGLRLGVPPCYWSNADRDVTAVLGLVRQKLSDAGVTFVEEDIPGLKELHALSARVIMAHEPFFDIPAYLAEFGTGEITLDSIIEQVASPDVSDYFRVGRDIASWREYDKALCVYRPQLQKAYAAYFEQQRVDAIFSPTTPITAVPRELFFTGCDDVSINGAAPFSASAAYTQNTGPGSNAGIPGISLPAGMSHAGLPVGMSLDGPVQGDNRLLGIGLAVEQLIGGLPPPLL